MERAHWGEACLGGWEGWPRADTMPPVLDFEDFYRKVYLPEHRDERSRALHFLGTVVALGFAAGHPQTIISGTTAVGAGLSVRKPLAGQKSGLLEFAVLLAVFLGLQWAFLGSLALAAAPLGVGYGCAWVGHFFLEKNRPATFVQPTLSLIGDFCMFFDALRGRL